LFRHAPVVFLVILSLFSHNLAAQTTQSCQALPPESPVASYSPDDVPLTNVDIVTYTGMLQKARANHNFCFVEISPTDQRVWFGVDASPGLFRTFYNRRVRDYVGGPWRWLYSYSPEIVRFFQPSSSGPASVHYSDTAKYRDPATGNYYKFIMYQGFQPGSCDGQVAAFLYVAFSNDGVCWTEGREVHRTGGPSFPSCYPGHINTVPIEQMQAIDGGDRLWLIGVEGDINALIPPADGTMNRWNAMNRTQTYIGWTSYTSPDVLNLIATPEITANGMFKPVTGPANASHPDRYAPYNYFMNLAVGFDAGTGYFYMGRGYPYAYDRGSKELAGVGISDPPSYYNVPTTAQEQNVDLAGPNGTSSVEGCLGAPYTLPNRIQIYRMYIGSMSNIGLLATGTWQLVADMGGQYGFSFKTGWGNTLRVTPQTNDGHDWGAVSFIRDRNGNLIRDGFGQVQLFGAHTFKQMKSWSSPCRITGFEREVYFTLP
jgi:hypothetical protein